METIKLVGNVSAAVVNSFFRKFMRRPKKSIVGEVALVTGAGHGLGQLLSLKLAALGATVIVVDINESTNKHTASMIKEAGGKVFDFTCDVSQLESIQKLGKDVRETIGDVTILVNNAAVVYVTDIFTRTDEMICKTFDVNVISHFRTIKEFLPAMKRNNHGHLVSVSSQAGFLGVGYIQDYCATKHAILGMLDGIRRELRWEGVTGITTTAACPSWINTGFAQNPKSNCLALSPVLTTEYVAEEIMKAVLADEPRIELPPATGLFFVKTFFPDAVVELLVDYIKPVCDRTH